LSAKPPAKSFTIMKKRFTLIALLAAAALSAPAYDLNIADCPTTATNATATATLPYVNVTGATGFALSLTATMERTLDATTNLVWYSGSVTCVASNSIDAIVWYPDPERSFTFTVATNVPVALLTNFTGLGAIGYERYTVTVSNNVNLTWTAAVKPGF